MHNAVPLQITPGQLEVGQIAEGSVVTRTAFVRNSSTHPLHLERLYTSCGCTTAHLAHVLDPGQTVPLRVRFDSSGKPGSINKHVLLFLAEYPDHPIEVPLSGHVTQIFCASPNALSLGTVRLGSVATSHLTLSRLDGNPLKAVGLKSAGLQTAVQTVNAETSRITVSVHAPDLPGTYQETVTLGVNNSSVPRFSVPITFQVPSVYHLAPETINYGMVRMGQDRQAQVHISGADVRRLKLASAPAGVTTVLKQVSNTECLLTANYAVKGEHSHLLNSQIILKTENTAQKTIAVPVYAAYL